MFVITTYTLILGVYIAFLASNQYTNTTMAVLDREKNGPIRTTDWFHLPNTPAKCFVPQSIYKLIIIGRTHSP